jgi:hypothetical protein
VLRCEGSHAIERKGRLNGQRLLGPEHSVVVEDGDALGGSDEAGRAFV